MKINKKNLISSALFVGILGGAGIIWKLCLRGISMDQSKIRIAFNTQTSVTAFDPARIQFDTEAVVLDNLYSPLVRVSNEGLIEPFFAEHYRWEGNTLHLQIRSNYKTVDGWPVSAKDAEFSLKRILASDSNAHGNLMLFLCPGHQVQGVDAPCPGIAATDSELLLTVMKENYKPFLLKLLASMDFGIVPKAACNLKSPKFEIIDYRNTTGPYYVSQDDPHGAFVLNANPNHWLHDSGLPEVVQFVPSMSFEAFENIKKGSIDFISAVMTPPSKELDDLRSNDNLRVFDTFPIKKLLIASTREKLAEFSVPERLAVYEQIRDVFFSAPTASPWNRSLDFYPALGEGALSSAQMAELKGLTESSRKTKIHRQVVFGVQSPRAFALFSPGLKDNPNFKVVMISKMAAFLPESERPDFYLGSTDAAFLESFSLVSYNVLAEIVDLTKEESGPWLERYMSVDKPDRIRMLKELNFRTLSKGIIGVLGDAPYTEVARKPYRYDGSRYSLGSALWMIRRD